MSQHFFLILAVVLLVGCKNHEQPLNYDQQQEGTQPNIIVIYTDDHGYADLGVQGQVSDIKTPYTDELAREGIRMTAGYVTAPQCVPSRAGLLTGKFQARFGLEANGSSLEGFNAELTIAERLKKEGYVTAQFGKWHLGPTNDITSHGFGYVFAQNANRPFFANVDLKGQDRPMSKLNNEMYHIDGNAKAASSIIERYSDYPFFLYIAFRAPHVPLDATEKYLKRFPGEMPERRRKALAMISAMDDGVGLIRETLKEEKLLENTLIFYISDNGAPLKIHKGDKPGIGPGWDGSLNTPLNGEKGMLTEGGIRVPFIVSWPGTLPKGEVYDKPVSTLDVAATSVSVAGQQVDPELGGVNLIPYLSGERNSVPHEFLAWRWIGQSAIRQGKWKFLYGDGREYLFDLKNDTEEQENLIKEYPEIADGLRSKLKNWTTELDPPGLTNGEMPEGRQRFFEHYLE